MRTRGKVLKSVSVRGGGPSFLAQCQIRIEMKEESIYMYKLSSLRGPIRRARSDWAHSFASRKASLWHALHSPRARACPVHLSLCHTCHSCQAPETVYIYTYILGQQSSRTFYFALYSLLLLFRLRCMHCRCSHLFIHNRLISCIPPSVKTVYTYTYASAIRLKCNFPHALAK